MQSYTGLSAKLLLCTWHTVVLHNARETHSYGFSSHVPQALSFLHLFSLCSIKDLMIHCHLNIPQPPHFEGLERKKRNSSADNTGSSLFCPNLSRWIVAMAFVQVVFVWFLVVYARWECFFLCFWWPHCLFDHLYIRWTGMHVNLART